MSKMKNLIELGGTKFSVNYLHQAKPLLEFHWIDQEQEMKIEDFQEALLKYVDLVKTHQPNLVLVNAEKLNFAIVPDLQEWVDENINAVTTPIVKKMAVILPHTLIEQLSIEQVLDEKEGKKIDSNFFSNYEEAFNWVTT